MIVPERMQGLPQYNGQPIPWLVNLDDKGVPQFSLNDEVRRRQAIEERFCGQCGQPFDYWIACIGDEVVLRSRITPEPAMHEECARYAFAVCPYLYAKNYSVKARPPRAKKAIVAPWTQISVDREGSAMGIFVTRGYHIIHRGQNLTIKFNPPKRIIWQPKPSGDESH